jgi:hypothetical protein
MTSAVMNYYVASVAYEISGILSTNNRPTYSLLVFPNITPARSGPAGSATVHDGQNHEMKNDPIPPTAALATLQDVLARLATNRSLSETRKRDLHSACLAFGKLTGKAPAMMQLDRAAIRATLDAMVPAQAKVSRKRFANLRSDFGSAIEASGLRPMIKTAGVELSESWTQLFEGISKKRVCYGLSRFARWASQRQIAPPAVDAAVVGRFISDLEAASLTRNIRDLHRSVTNSWNGLVPLRPGENLQLVEMPISKAEPGRVPWQYLPASFRTDVDQHLIWGAVPDPLDEKARVRALAPRTLNLRRDHVHSAATAAVSAGIEVQQLISLASLVEIETFKKLMRQRWEQGGRKLTSYTHGVAGTLIAIAKEWVMVPADKLATLKLLRCKLGSLPSGLTEKNKIFLRQFDDPRLLDAFSELPNKLWRLARRDLATSRRPFIDLQSALAIDLSLHVPLRMENLSALNFEKHLHWPQGRGKPARIVFNGADIKNRVPLEFEISTVLAERL